MIVDAVNRQFNTVMKTSVIASPFSNQKVKNGSTMPSSSDLNKRHEIKKQLMQTDNNRSNMPVNSVMENSKSYIDSLRESRNRTKNTALEKKKLKYSYKAISSKILNCKKSYSAKEVVRQAKREVVRLKRLRSNNEYDSEELEAAISHAQSMERVARKKAKHLEEEEMVKTSGGVCFGEVEEEKNSEEMPKEEQTDLESDNDEEKISATEDDSIAQLVDMIEEFSQDISELTEDLGLEDLLEDTGIAVDKDMDPADLKMMIIKHRNKEMKDMAEADGLYLKTMFENLNVPADNSMASIDISV